MSARTVEWAFAAPVKRSSDRLVLVAMANFARAGDLFFAACSTLCEATLLDRKTVIQSIGRLQEQNLIADTEQRKGRTAGVIVYQLAVPPSGAENGTASTPPSGAENGTASTPPSGAENGTASEASDEGKLSRFSHEAVPKTGQVPSTTLYKLPESRLNQGKKEYAHSVRFARESSGRLFDDPEPSKPASPKAADKGQAVDHGAEFDAFWQLVPRKVDRKDARAAFGQARTKKRIPFETILDGMRRYAGMFAPEGAKDPQYAAGPAKWLRAERWTDELPAPPPVDDRVASFNATLNGHSVGSGFGRAVRSIRPAPFAGTTLDGRAEEGAP